jgi:hypothetical protein
MTIVGAKVDQIKEVVVTLESDMNAQAFAAPLDLSHVGEKTTLDAIADSPKPAAQLSGRKLTTGSHNCAGRTLEVRAVLDSNRGSARRGHLVVAV